MNVFRKWCFVLLLGIGSIYSQSTKILSIDSIAQLGPIIMNDTTYFQVVVSVNDTSLANVDSTGGMLFYYYLTDSMILAGTPPRVIAPNTDTVLIHPMVVDSVPVDIRPDEIRTEPVNLIILWPSLHNTMFDISDSDSVTIQILVDGFLRAPEYGEELTKLLYPVPALQLLYIRPEDLPAIHMLRLLTLTGEVIRTYGVQDLSTGYVYITDIPAGTYLTETVYENGKIHRQKIVKY